MKKNTSKRTLLEKTLLKKSASKKTGLRQNTAATMPVPVLPSAFLDPVYRREEIAPIAAQLLEGDDFEQAVKRAIRLLEECDRQNRLTEEDNCFATAVGVSEAEQEAARSLGEKERDALPITEKLRLELPVRFIDAVKSMTGQSRADRAKEKLLKWIEDGRNWGPTERTSWGKLFDEMAKSEYYGHSVDRLKNFLVQGRKPMK